MSRFGTTCPWLKLSQHYGIRYAAALAIGDYMIHGRGDIDAILAELVAYDLPVRHFLKDAGEIAIWFDQLRGAN